MGPYETIGSISWEKQLANLGPAAVFFGSTNRPIHDYWQHVFGTTMGLSDTIGSMSLEGHWAHCTYTLTIYHP